MSKFFVQLPAGDTVILDLDLHTATVATVKATVDARLESAWRASGVRILRSDLPFCGIRLRYQNELLAMDKALFSYRIRKGTTLYAEWPSKSEKNERRKRYGTSWDAEAVLERRVKGKKKEKRAAEKTLYEAAQDRSPELGGNSTLSASKFGGEGFLSDDRLDDNTEPEWGDGAEPGGEGTQAMNRRVSLSERVTNREQDEQQAREVGQGNRLAQGAEQEDAFANEDDNKENREPAQAIEPVVEDRVDEDTGDEWMGFDERNGDFLGVDLMEVVDF